MCGWLLVFLGCLSTSVQSWLCSESADSTGIDVAYWSALIVLASMPSITFFVLWLDHGSGNDETDSSNDPGRHLKWQVCWSRRYRITECRFRESEREGERGERERERGGGGRQKGVRGERGSDLGTGCNGTHLTFTLTSYFPIGELRVSAEMMKPVRVLELISLHFRSMQSQPLFSKKSVSTCLIFCEVCHLFYPCAFLFRWNCRTDVSHLTTISSDVSATSTTWHNRWVLGTVFAAQWYLLLHAALELCDFEALRELVALAVFVNSLWGDRCERNQLAFSTGEHNLQQGDPPPPLSLSLSLSLSSFPWFPLSGGL